MIRILNEWCPKPVNRMQRAWWHQHANAITGTHKHTLFHLRACTISFSPLLVEKLDILLQVFLSYLQVWGALVQLSWNDRYTLLQRVDDPLGLFCIEKSCWNESVFGMERENIKSLMNRNPLYSRLDSFQVQGSVCEFCVQTIFPRVLIVPHLPKLMTRLWMCLLDFAQFTLQRCHLRGQIQTHFRISHWACAWKPCSSDVIYAIDPHLMRLLFKHCFQFPDSAFCLHLRIFGRFHALC